MLNLLNEKKLLEGKKKKVFSSDWVVKKIFNDNLCECHFSASVLKFSVPKIPREICRASLVRSRTFLSETSTLPKKVEQDVPWNPHFLPPQFLLESFLFIYLFPTGFRKYRCKGHSLISEFQIESTQAVGRKIMTFLINETNLIRNDCEGINMELCNLICTVSFHLYSHPLRSLWGNEYRHNHLVLWKLRVIKNLRLKPSLISGQCEVRGTPVPKYFLVCRWWNAKWYEKRF